ncbi:twin-arginine translocation signal domain-containing protein [Escherichia coli]|nr:twin-arginine translocation signal domain-containing protein [Escherichia coli]
MKLSRRSFMKANAVAAAAAAACRSQRAGRCPRRCWSAGSHQMG